MLLVICLLIFALMAASVYLLYCVRPSMESPMGKIRQAVLNDFPKHFGAFGDRILGPQFSRTLIRVRNYIFFSNNPLVMMFYISIITACYYLYIEKVFFEHAKYISMIDVVAGNMTAFMTFYFYFRTLRTPPVVVNSSNVKKLVDKYARFYDGTVYVEGKICQTCKIEKLCK